MRSKLITGIVIGACLGAAVVLSILGVASLMDGGSSSSPGEVAAARAPGEAVGVAPVQAGAGSRAAEAKVAINGRALTARQVRELEEQYGVRPEPGNYWYDARSGLYGIVGMPAAGFMLPGHDFGALAAHASGGQTNVFVNGRNLPQPEVMILSALWGTYIQPSHYWLDGAGNVGYEGIPIPVGNLYALAQARGAIGGGGGDNFWNSRFSAGNYNADNTQGYVSVPGYGPVGYGFD
jgi:hypothetical protein